MIGRIPILDVWPVVDCGRWPAKAVVGEALTVEATVFRDGHDAVAANVVLRDPRGRRGPFTRMAPLGPGTDRWTAEIRPSAAGRWTFQIEGWADAITSWWHDASIKVPAGVDVELMLETGAALYERATAEVPRSSRPLLLAATAALRDSGRAPAERLSSALTEELRDLLRRYPLRDLLTPSERYPLLVERERALVGAWYEFFPRSEGARVDPPRSGSFATARARLPAVAEMGFDVVYLPPIHPIGRSARKGPNNTLEAPPGAPGSPWAIGAEEGGHDAIHPDLGTLADFDAFVATATELGLEVALDLAIQCSPDHPWLSAHPEWFFRRVDSSIAPAENPPKVYQDIYPVNFDQDPDGIYAEILRVVQHWIAHGVRIFRVDNPHTKPVPFWERLLADVRRSDPDVVWLSEAFTRPAMMHTLGKIGFTQSYTYFTWRTEKWELESFVRELAGPAAAYLRPNFFVNTPDILHAYLQTGGPPAFKIRAVLAALLSPSWGVYAGYELCENVPVRPGSEEYLDSEKFAYRPRDWSDPDSIAPYLARLNAIRRAHPALRRLRNLHLHEADQDPIMVWSKREGADAVIVVVNLDPRSVHEATVTLDLGALSLEQGAHFRVEDELTGATFSWSERNFVRLDPFEQPAHVLSVHRP